MSDFKMKMRLSTNQSSQETQNTPNQAVQQSIIRSLQNQNSFIKLGYSGVSRNYAALIVQGQKFCKSCNEKK
jgi:hypothetical protein|tara:strand:+ start:2675 stop:2890 length:216 start_codon:yes stop_codon:yes gene_type:complete